MKSVYRLILLLFMYSFLVPPENYAQKTISYANNIPVQTTRSEEGIYARPYAFDKDNVYKETDWKAQWIWLNDRQFPSWQRARSTWIHPPAPDPAPYRALFRKGFNLARLPEKAILFMTADTRFRVYINNQPVGEGPVNTGSDYGDGKPPSYWYYSSFNVRDRLKAGMNTIAVEVFAWALEGSETSSSFGRLIGELQNGDKDILLTDTTWKATVDTSYSYASGFLQYDARRERAGWTSNAFADDQWPLASRQHAADSTRLFPSNIPGLMTYPLQPLRVFTGLMPGEGEIDPRQFYGRPADYSSYILDFGRNIAARIHFTVTANSSDTLEITPYEKMGPNPAGNRSLRYLCKAGSNTFRTPDIAIFRYLQVRAGRGSGIAIQQLGADFTTYPVQYRGSFHCSDPFYTQLWSIARYTTQLCMSDMFFDSPMHQEPIGCTGDYFIESMNNYYAFGDPWLTRQNLVQTAQMMEKNNYRMFHTSYSLLWVQMLRQYVLFTGDTGVLDELLPHADKLMNRFKGYLNKDGLVAEAPDYMFMDWITIKGFNAHHPPAMIGMGYMSMLFYKALRDIDDMRSYAGSGRSHTSYAALADSVKKGINTVLWDPNRMMYRDGIPFITHTKPGDWLPADSNLVTYSAHANTMAVLYDVAAPDTREGIMDYVVTQNAYELQPYFMSYVLGAVQKTLGNDRGLELIDRWRKGIDTITYTLKENWQDITESGYGGDYSHAWGGSPLRWLSGNLLGISPETPGYATIAIHPYTGEKITWANGSVPIGNKDSIGVSWAKKANGFHLEYTIPSGRTTRFYIPVPAAAPKAPGNQSTPPYSLQVDGQKYEAGGEYLELTPGKHTLELTKQGL